MPKHTETNLHIQFKMETGDYFKYIGNIYGSDDNHPGTGYHSTKGYRQIYTKWLEQKLLELLNKNTN